eukprot:jgi/Ulvmu1/10336/UM061_0019.1
MCEEDQRDSIQNDTQAVIEVDLKACHLRTLRHKHEALTWRLHSQDSQSMLQMAQEHARKAEADQRMLYANFEEAVMDEQQSDGSADEQSYIRGNLGSSKQGDD